MNWVGMRVGRDVGRKWGMEEGDKECKDVREGEQGEGEVN